MKYLKKLAVLFVVANQKKTHRIVQIEGIEKKKLQRMIFFFSIYLTFVPTYCPLVADLYYRSSDILFSYELLMSLKH